MELDESWNGVNANLTSYCQKSVSKSIFLRQSRKSSDPVENRLKSFCRLSSISWCSFHNPLGLSVRYHVVCSLESISVTKEAIFRRATWNISKALEDLFLAAIEDEKKFISVPHVTEKGTQGGMNATRYPRPYRHRHSFTPFVSSQISIASVAVHCLV